MRRPLRPSRASTRRAWSKYACRVAVGNGPSPGSPRSPRTDRNLLYGPACSPEETTMYPGTFAATHPDRPAVIMAETGEGLTYRELEDGSVRLARTLHEHGLRRGDVVALLSDNHPRVFEVYWAAQRAGLLVTAVNHHLSADEAAYIVDDC